ncbi:hypothetical protein GCM10012289_49970 [Nonomuraea cavernae]|uniref:Uncharacterized protein n=1 Tax=Nonomuraea cavernae TaxID=2045107 RepID=A0A917Z7V3_9ACTN|nr:hypothetical protein GCM10012289_49970 [Nonomuraea cavernae]
MPEPPAVRPGLAEQVFDALTIHGANPIGRRFGEFRPCISAFGTYGAECRDGGKVRNVDVVGTIPAG